MTQNSPAGHIIDHIAPVVNTGTKKKASRLTVGTQVDDQTMAQIDVAIDMLNRKLPAFAQINRSQFVKGAIDFAMRDLDQMLEMPSH